MADEKDEAPQEEKKKSPVLLVLLVGVMGAAGGGAGAYFLAPKPSAAPGIEQEAEADDTVLSEGFAERLYELDPFVVNVSGEGYPRYVKLDLAFELDSVEARAEFEERVAQVRDLTILLLSSKRLSDIEDFEGKALLKDDLRERVNVLLAKGSVESVMFTEFVIQ